MITPQDFENAKRLAGALERRFDGEDLQRLASVLNYVPEQLQVETLALDLEEPKKKKPRRKRTEAAPDGAAPKGADGSEP